MQCYRDKTFCTFWEECKLGSECHRAYTSEVQKAAERWWKGDNPPICFFADKPKCFVEDNLCQN